MKLLNPGYGKVIVDDKIFDTYNLLNNTKTKTVRNGSFTVKLQSSAIRIAPQTYWRVGRYDHQFEGNDANCWLCGWYGTSYGSDEDRCNCKKSFSIEEHINNLPRARRNFLKTWCENYMKKAVTVVKKASDEDIFKVLSPIDPKQSLESPVYFPSWFESSKGLEIMKAHVSAHLIEKQKTANG